MFIPYRSFTACLFWGLLLANLCCGDSSTGFRTTQRTAGGKVQIVPVGNGFRLLREDRPYFIKGAAGRARPDLVRAAGGNAIRTYTTDGLDTLLDRAHALGLSVMAGIYLGRECEGFNYQDTLAVAQQHRMALDVVERHKHHPALLCWALGNELDNESEQPQLMWRRVNELALAVKNADPDHPVTTCVSFWAPSLKILFDGVPALDFVSINAFGNLWEVDQYFRQQIKQPYLISEWGTSGPWEVQRTEWSAPVEKSLREKHTQIRDTYRRHIAANTSHCLGSFAFYWGQKQETSPTWFSFFSENGEKTTLVDLSYELWGGGKPANQAPVPDTILAAGQGVTRNRYLQSGAITDASVQATDPDGDPLSYRWEITPEGSVFNPDDIGRELKPDSLRGLIVENAGKRIRFRVPAKTGPYRLAVLIRDGQGGAAYAALPFYAVNHQLVE